MPVTFAHPAVVLPLRRTPMPLSALAVGSMIPDLSLFVPGVDLYGFAHTIPGILTADLALGLAVWAVWRLVLADPVTAAVPPRAAEAIRRSDPRPAPWWWAVPAVTVGAASHVFVDEFTHAGRWGSTHIPWLAHEHLGLAGYKWMQYGGGLLGVLVIVGFAAALWWCVGSRPVGDPVAPEGTAPRTPAAWAILASPLVGAIVGAVLLLRAPTLTDGMYDAITRGGAVAALTVLVGAILWHASDRRSARTP